MTFNFYFAGFGCKEADAECMKLNKLRLLSYYLDKPRVELWREEKMPIFLDSGAFTAHTKGVEIDVNDYIGYINERDEYLTCFAQLDTIPGEFGKPKTKEQLEEAPEKTWENYLYMYDKVKSPKKLMPIFHQGEDFKHLRRMLEHKPKIEYMGISPANDVSTPRKAVWMAECFEIIKKSSNPKVKTHAFGMTSLPLLEQFPFYSADSTSWLMSGRTGGIMTKYGSNLIISENLIKDPNHVVHMGKPFLKELERYVGKFGFNLEELQKDYKKRMLFNMHYLTDWASKYERKEKTVVQHTLF